MSKWLQFASILLVLSLLAEWSNLTVHAQDPRNEDDPDFARVVGVSVSSIPAHEGRWFQFNYSFASYNLPRPKVTARLLNGAQNGLAFEIWSPERLQGNWFNNEPIGRGTRETIAGCTHALSDGTLTKCTTNDLVWVGGFGALGNYYVRIVNTSDSPITPQLVLSGPGLGQCVNPAAAPSPGPQPVLENANGYVQIQCGSSGPNATPPLNQAIAPTLAPTIAATPVLTTSPTPSVTLAVAPTTTATETSAPASTSSPAPTQSPAPRVSATSATTAASVSSPVPGVSGTPAATAVPPVAIAPTPGPTSAPVPTPAQSQASSQPNQVTLDITISHSGRLSVGGVDTAALGVAPLPGQDLQWAQKIETGHLVLQGDLATLDAHGTPIVQVKWNPASRQALTDLAARYGFSVSSQVLARVEEWISTSYLDVTARYSDEPSKLASISLTKPLWVNVGPNGQVSVEQVPLALKLDASLLQMVKQGGIQDTVLCWDNGELSSRVNGKDLPVIILDRNGVQMVSQAVGLSIDSDLYQYFDSKVGVDVSLPGGEHQAGITCGK